MATTASLLKAGPVFMSWKNHQPFCSRQISSNNNFFSLKMKSDRLNPRNPTELRLVSNLRSELRRNYSKTGSSNLHDSSKLVCSSNNLFEDDDVGSISVVDKLSRKLLAGLLLMAMALALALRSRDSAFAASNGSGSISRSSTCSSYSYSGCHDSAEASEAAEAENAAEAAEAEKAASNAFTVAMILFIPSIYMMYNLVKHSGGTVVMLQVGILDKERVLQRKLNTIAESVDRSTSRGLSQLLEEVSYALLQHHDSCHFVYLLEESASFDHSMQNSLMPFYRRLKITECKRYDRFMNVDGVKLERPSAIKVNNSIDNKYSVVTVLVLARGRYSIPYLVGGLFRTLYSIQSEGIKDVEVFWSDTVSEQEIRRDFPYMISCYDKEKRFPKKWWKWLLAYLRI